MNSLFWSRLHGGLTHFPIALIFAAALFEALGFFVRGARGRHFCVIGYWLVTVAAAGALAAVFSGLLLSNWRVGGTGLLLRHHLFVWPAFALIVGLAAWRFLAGARPSRRSLAIYLGVMTIACGLVGGAGFYGGELLLGR